MVCSTNRSGFCSGFTVASTRLILLDEAITPRTTFLPSLLAQLLAELDSTLCVICEDEIDLFECEIGRFRIAEVDQGHKKEIESHEDEVTSPCEPVQEDRRDHDDEEVPEP